MLPETMTRLTINSTCTKGPLYPMLVNFKNGYPTDHFEIDCAVLEDKNGNRIIAAEASGIIYAGKEENDILGKTYILARNRVSGNVRLIEVRRAELQPVNDIEPSSTNNFEICKSFETSASKERAKGISRETIPNDTGDILWEYEGDIDESCNFSKITNEDKNDDVSVIDHRVKHSGNTLVNAEVRNNHKKNDDQEHCNLHSNTHGAQSNTLNNMNFDLPPESRSYICHYCEKTFRTKPKLVVHIGTHNMINEIKTSKKLSLTCKNINNHDKKTHKSKNTKIKFYSCPTCDYMTTKSKHRLEMHILTHTMEKPFKCHICEYASNTNTNLKRHVLTHTQKMFNCKFCTRKFKEQGSLIRHIKTHDNTVNTDATQKYRKDSSLLKEEIIIKKNEVLRNYVCNYCGRGFKSKTFLIAHIAVHNKAVNISKSNGKHQCVSCNVAFSTQSDLLNHDIKIHNLKAYKSCTICDYKTSYSSRLTIHMRIHTGQKPFKCDICDYNSKTSTDLKAHRRKHAKQKPYDCKICYAEFAQKNSLKHHMNIHTGEKPHKCTFCDAKFAQPSGLRRHLIIHMGGKPYKCTICSASFSDSSSMNRHAKTHAKVCSECGSKFTSNQNLRKHMKIHK